MSTVFIEKDPTPEETLLEELKFISDYFILNLPTTPEELDKIPNNYFPLYIDELALIEKKVVDFRILIKEHQQKNHNWFNLLCGMTPII